MTYLDPDLLSDEQRLAVDAWITANGGRHYVALEPVLIRGNVIEYVALCRKDSRSLRRMPIKNDEVIPLGVKRLRMRVPLSTYLRRNG